MDAIEIPSLDLLIAKLKSLDDFRFANAALMAGGLYLKGKVATYPPVNRPRRSAVYGHTFQSDRQRRFFFAAMRSGKIDVPYRRGASPGSEGLGRRWTVVQAAPFEVVIGNNVTYGPLVQSRAHPQSLYMRAVGWQTVEDVVERYGDETIRLVDSELAKTFSSLIGGK